MLTQGDEEYSYWMDQQQKAESERDPNAWWFGQIGLCGVYPRPSDTTEIAQNREQCMAFNNQYNPSIGTDGRFCQCWKPQVDHGLIEVQDEDLLRQRVALEDRMGSVEDGEEQASPSDAFYLSPSDFVSGTYRITAPGTYVVTEDIVFDFNAGDAEAPNLGGGWWPRKDQRDEYPGADTTRDEYFMGFFAGITIEADDVTLDLNGFSLSMSRAFYYQQRFFSCISLQSVVFNLNQGPGIFGTNPVYANNVVIRNGNVGLSSHHGIHGHGNTGVLIEDVHVYDFETHGIQLSAFEGVTLRNVEIGPSSSIAYLNGEYGYARFTLQRLERIAQSGNMNDVFPFAFAGRDDTVETLSDIIDPLRSQMDEAFKFVMGIEAEISPEARRLFVNDDGIPYGAVMYGLFLNLFFANVFQIHPSEQHSVDAVLENVEIHDLTHKTREYLRLDEFSITPYANPYNAALDARSVLGDDVVNMGYDGIPWPEVDYVGDALIDAHIAMDMVTEDWGEKGLMVIGRQFSDWAQGKHRWSMEDDHFHPFLGCNGDRMTHSAKGIMGIRIDGVDDVSFDSLHIHHLHEQSPMGSTLCTEYWDGNMENFFGTGHFLQKSPYFYGYTGNMVHAIFADFTQFAFSGESRIENLYSDTGLVYAVGAYTSVQIEVNGQLQISDLGAGTALKDVDTSLLRPPYHPAISKPFHVISEWTKFGNTFESAVVVKPESAIKMRCIYGRDGTLNDVDSTMIDLSDCAVDSVFATKLSFSSSLSYHQISGALLLFLCLSSILYVAFTISKRKKVPMARQIDYGSTDHPIEL